MARRSRLGDVVQQFDKQSEVMPRLKWFADAERARELLAFARLTRGERILEVGCGPGFVLAEATAAALAVGVDVSPKMLRAAASRAAHARVVRAAVERLPFSDHRFDLVYCRSVLHHALEPEAMVREMARVTRVGGRVVINDSISSENRQEAGNHNRMERLRDPSHGRMVPASELIDLFHRARLRVAEVRAHRYARDAEEFLDVTSPEPSVRAELLRLFRGWTDHDESGLFVRYERGRIRFDHTQWTVLGVKD
ncbi:MAG TPA: class I SAM-dependent methyltransferase [Thermoplasmata archaeon]|nr:class I SAM-dependent methyltransferase [Thermoplasmata archaeon]